MLLLIATLPLRNDAIDKMPFSYEDKSAIKLLRQQKGYGANKLIKEFPSKRWTKGGLDKLLKKIDSTGSIERKQGSGRQRSVRTDDKIHAVEDLVLSQDNAPQTHRSQREIARETRTKLTTVNRIIKEDLHLHCFKKHRAQELTEANKTARLSRSKQLLRLYPSHMVNFIMFTDEKIFTVATPKNNQNDRVYGLKGTRRQDIVPERLLRTRSTYSQSLMVSVGVSMLGRTGIHFIEPRVKINGDYYRNVLLTQKLLPDIEGLSDYFIFQQDGAPAHRARQTVELLQRCTPDFIPPTLWPPNSPDLNPVDYKIWSVMQDKVYKTKVKNIDDLRQRIERAWDEFDQRIIDRAVLQWRGRLRACVRANGAQFEHKL